MKREESLKMIEKLIKSQGFDPLWKFLIPSIKNIIDKYYENSEVKCSIEITDNEKEQYNLSLLYCINVIREILYQEVDIKCTLISLHENILKVSFKR